MALVQEGCNRSWLYSSLQVPRPAPSLSGAEPLNPGRREPARERLRQNSRSPRRRRYPPTPPGPQTGGPANTPQSWSPAPPRPPGGLIHPDASTLPHPESLQPEFAAHAQVLDFHVSLHLILHCLMFSLLKTQDLVFHMSLQFPTARYIFLYADLGFYLSLFAT